MNFKKLIVIILVIVFVFLLLSPYILSPFEVPLNTFFKVNSQDLVNGTCIVLVSWYGCPFGATDSWVLYAFLSHYGKLTFNITYSNPNDVYPNTPGLIFTEFYPNSTIHFKFLYLYNRFLNGTTNNTPISNYVSYGLSVIKQKLPEFYNIIKEYVTEKWASGGFFQPVAYMGNPPHIPTLIIITSPKGTYMLIGSIISPSEIKGYSPSYLLSHIYQIQAIQQGVEEIENFI